MKNTYRIIFWSFVLMSCLALGVLGIFRNNQIYNSKKTLLNSVVDSFNNSEVVRNFRVEQNVLISAKLNRSNILVTYDAGETKKTYKYKIGLGYLTNTYDKNDNFANTFTMLLTDGISEYYGRNKKAVYEVFNNNTIYSYTFDNGIEYKFNNNKYTVKINLDTPLNIYNTVNEQNALDID